MVDFCDGVVGWRVELAEVAARRTMMTTPLITAYRDGHFCTVDEPAWWIAAINDPRTPAAKGCRHLGSCYATDFEIVEANPIADRDGMIVKIFDCEDMRLVWCITEADYLDFLTTRAPALLRMATTMQQEQSIRLMSNAVVKALKRKKRLRRDRKT